MYNEKLKRRFINEYSKNAQVRNMCESVFNYTGKYEELYGRDFCTFNEDEIQQIVDNEFVGIRALGIENKLFILKSYARWCMSNNIKGAGKSVFNVTAFAIDDLRVKTLANPLHLSMFLDAYFTPDEVEAPDSIYRCFYWLAYMGFIDKDVFDIKCSDVDLDNMVVRYTPKNIVAPIYWESIQTFRNCALLDYFMLENPNPRVKDRTRIARVEGDLLLRSLKGKPNLASFRSSLTRFSAMKAGNSKLQMTYKRVWYSGIFYRSFLDESLGIQPEFKRVAMERELAKSKSGVVNPDRLKARVHGYKLDYDRWKLAWYYRS